MNKHEKQFHVRVAHHKLQDSALNLIHAMRDLDSSSPNKQGYGMAECQVLRSITDACEAFQHLRVFDGVSEDETLPIQEAEKQLRERVHKSMQED